MEISISKNAQQLDSVKANMQYHHSYKVKFIKPNSLFQPAHSVSYGSYVDLWGAVP